MKEALLPQYVQLILTITAPFFRNEKKVDALNIWNKFADGARQ